MPFPLHLSGQRTSPPESQADRSQQEEAGHTSRLGGRSTRFSQEHGRVRRAGAQSCQGLITAHPSFNALNPRPFLGLGLERETPGGRLEMVPLKKRFSASEVRRQSMDSEDFQNILTKVWIFSFSWRQNQDFLSLLVHQV